MNSENQSHEHHWEPDRYRDMKLGDKVYQYPAECQGCGSKAWPENRGDGTVITDISTR